MSFFGSLFAEEQLSDMPALSFHMVGSELSDVVITPRIVKKIHNLNPYSAPRPDEIHPRVLREASQVLSGPLAFLYCKALDTGMVLQDWKLGRIVPILKKEIATIQQITTQ